LVAIAAEHVALGRDADARPLFERVFAVAHEPDEELERGRFRFAKLCARAGERERAVELATLAREHLRTLGLGDDPLAPRIGEWLTEYGEPGE
jgi:hypothetical protein